MSLEHCFSTLATYISWMVVQSKLVHASTPFQQALLELERKLLGVEGDEQRWQKCTEFSESALGFATGALYVDRFFSESDKHQVIKLCHYLFCIHIMHIGSA